MEPSPRILIAEDDAVLITNLQDTLSRMGYRVSGLAATGQAAVELALANRPDAILMDIRLRGGMTGIQAAAQIHQQFDIPIIYLTAYTDDILLQEAKTTDAYAFLSKPVRDRELHASLDMALFKHKAEQRMQHLNQVLHALRDVNQLITRGHEALPLLDEACKILLHTRGYRSVWVGHLVGPLLELVAYAGEGRNLLEHILANATLEQGRKLPGAEAARTGQVVVCVDMRHDERYAPWQAEVEKALFFSTVAVPILNEGRLFGVLNVYADQPYGFDAEEIDLLLELAGDIAFGLKAISQEEQRKQQEAALRQSEAELTALNQIGKALSKLAEPNEILERIFNEIGHVLDTSNLFIALYDPARQVIAFQVYTMKGDRIQGRSRSLRNGITEYVIRTNKPLLIKRDLAGALSERGIEVIGTNARSFLAVPMSADDKVLGVIALQDYDRDYVYDEHHLELLTTVAAQAAIALENARLFSAVRQELEERRRAEGALQQSQEQLQAVVQTANDAIITMDAQQAIVFWNAAAEHIFGFPAEEMLGKPMTLVVPVQFRERYRQESERHVAASERSFSARDRQAAGITIETTGLTRAGKLFPIEMSLAEWKTKTGLFVTAIIRDISDRWQHEREVQAISTLSAALRTAPSRTHMLPVIVEQMVNLLNCDSGTVEIIEPLSGDAVVEAAYGKWKPLVGYRQGKGTGLNAVISETLKPYTTPNLEGDPNPVFHQWARQGIRGSAGVPLVAQSRLIGFVWVGRATELADSEVRLLTAIADIAANAIHRATLHDQTRKDAADLALAYDTTLEGWAHALELRDQETEGHTRRVVQMTLALAQVMGVPQAGMENIRRGALLHDIGKMGIPDSVLLKPGTLNERELEIMRRHPEYAYNFLSPIDYLKPALDIPFYHHEKWDGTGYPTGLLGNAIPLSARIFAIVDVWDALTSDRPYRAAWAKDKALAYIREQCGKHFDPLVVEGFLSLKPNG